MLVLFFLFFFRSWSWTQTENWVRSPTHPTTMGCTRFVCDSILLKSTSADIVWVVYVSEKSRGINRSWPEVPVTIRVGLVRFMNSIEKCMKEEEYNTIRKSVFFPLSVEWKRVIQTLCRPTIAGTGDLPDGSGHRAPAHRTVVQTLLQRSRSGSRTASIL